MQSQPLQLHEIAKMKADPECMKRFLKSYDMQLHFYGCRVKDRQTGELERHADWEKHYRNLNSHYHNNLRITRVLKSLGELGYEHYKRPFLEHFIKEIWVEKVLPECADSCADYWIGTMKDDKDRAALEAKVAQYRVISPEADSDSEDAVEQSWTSSRPSIHPYAEQEADGAGSDDDDEDRAKASKALKGASRDSLDEQLIVARPTATKRKIAKEKEKEKDEETNTTDRTRGIRGVTSGSGSGGFYITQPAASVSSTHEHQSSADQKKNIWNGSDEDPVPMKSPMNQKTKKMSI